jgi:glutathione reductase (NADPH)
LAIIGAGYIAMEFASIFNALGSKVTIVNRTDVILRGYDRAVVDRLLDITRARGMDYRMNSQLLSVEKRGDGTLLANIGSDTLEADAILVATGRKPNTNGIGLDNAGIEIGRKGEIPVDEYNRTACESVYAVGDVTDRVQLTPVAIREGHAFADTVFGEKPRTISYDHVPSAVFSQPPIASVGLTEEEARTEHGKVKVYSSDFRPMKNIFSPSAERGLYRMVVDEESGKVVGLHMIGPESPEILQAAAIAIKAGLTKEDFDATVALHPSMAEELVLMR